MTHRPDERRWPTPSRAFKRGEIVVVTDDDDRENEGDLIVAAVHATPEKIAFIVRHTSGIVCAPMPRETRAPAAARSRWSPTTTPRSAPPSPSRSTSATA